MYLHDAPFADMCTVGSLGAVDLVMCANLMEHVGEGSDISRPVSICLKGGLAWPFRGVEGDVDLTLGILSAFFDGYLLIAEPE